MLHGRLAPGGPACGRLYRWEQDGSGDHAGHLLLERSGRLRASTAEGRLLGDLVLDPTDGEVRGSAAGVDVAAFRTAAASVLRELMRSGQPPEKAHRYFG